MPISPDLQTSRPLNATERRALEQSLRTLHREIQALLASLPVNAQTASGLAQTLNIDRTTCQRAVSAVMRPYPGLELVRQLPGAAGLRMLASAAEQSVPSGQVSKAASALRRAVDAYDELTRQFGGSRAKLLRRMGAADLAGQPALPGNDHTRYAAQLFESAAALTGRFSQTWLAAHIYAPCANDPGRLVQTRAHGLIGHRARVDAVPLTIHVFGSKGNAGAEVTAEPDAGGFVPLDPPRGDLPPTLLTRFSSTPPPVVRARQSDSFLVHAVDLGMDSGDDSAGNLVFGLHGSMTHPARTATRAEEVWALINFPARRMLLDVFLHRDLARACLPSLDMHLWSPDFHDRTGERWQTRFAYSPRLEVLGRGLAKADTEAFSRHAELLAFMFEKRGLNPDDFVGFRCSEEFPMWRTGYRMCFEFGESRECGMLNDE